MSADLPIPDAAPGGEEQALLDACRVALVDGSSPESGELPVAPVATLNTRVAQTRRTEARVYLAVHDVDAVAVLASGPVEAIESPEIRGMPIGTMLLVDADGQRGELVAERVLCGWVLSS